MIRSAASEIGLTKAADDLAAHHAHAVRAMTKVGARDRAQLVAFTFSAGLYP